MEFDSVQLGFSLLHADSHSNRPADNPLIALWGPRTGRREIGKSAIDPSKIRVIKCEVSCVWYIK